MGTEGGYRFLGGSVSIYRRGESTTEPYYGRAIKAVFSRFLHFEDGLLPRGLCEIELRVHLVFDHSCIECVAETDKWVEVDVEIACGRSSSKTVEMEGHVSSSRGGKSGDNNGFAFSSSVLMASRLRSRAFVSRNAMIAYQERHRSSSLAVYFAASSPWANVHFACPLTRLDSLFLGVIDRDAAGC